MDLTLSRVVEAARQRRAAVTAEVGGYIVLLLLQLQSGGPRRVALELVGLKASGEVELAPSPAAERREVEAALRGLLASLLSLAQSAPPALRATSERAAVGDLAAFEAELTAALIPINHAASRRALARVFRETQKAQRGVSGAEQERESSPVPTSVRAPESSSAQPVSELPLSARAAVVRTPVPESRVSAPEPPVSVAQPLVRVAQPPVSVPQPGPAELEIDVDVDMAVPEQPLVAAGAVAAEPEPIVAARVSTQPERAEPEPQLEVGAEVEEVEEIDELDQLLASEPPPARLAAAPSLPTAPSDAAEAEAIEAAPTSLVHSLTPAARALTPLPASAIRRSGSAPPEVARERVESPAPGSVPWVAAGASEAEPAPQRSDLRDLLDGYLSYTRREEDMAAGLRRMIGLEPWRASGRASERPGLGQ